MLLQAYANDRLRALLSAVEGEPLVYVAVRCELGYTPRTAITTAPLPLFPQFVLEVRGWGGILSHLLTLDEIDPLLYGSGGDGERLALLLDSPPAQTPAGFCEMLLAM